jgi:Signal transduction histidine kinase
MRLETLLPDSLRSRYSLKLLCVSLGIVLVITAITATTVVDISDRVQTEQLNAIETNAELEARALGQWIDGKQQTVRVLSNHQGIVPANRSRTQSTLDGEMRQLSNETASLSIVERSPASFSNGTRETIIASTERELVGAPLRATDVNWKPTVGFNFDGTDDVILSWVYTDNTNRTFVALASPTPDGEHALVAEYQTSIRAEQFTSAVAGTETQVLGGFTAFVLFDQNASSGIVPYEGDRWNTTIGQRINATDPTTELQGSVLTDTAVKGYHSVPGDRVDWVVVKEVPQSTALALTDRVRNELWLLLGVVLVGFGLVGVVIQRGPIQSIKRVARQANAIATGDLTVDVEERDRLDEVGQVQAAFSNTKAYIETITRQAAALSRREFDSDALDEEIPGRVGESMQTMQQDLRRFISRLEVFNRVLRHNLRNQLDIIDSHAEAVADDSEGDTDHAEAILDATDRLAALGDRARRIDRLMSQELEPEQVDLTEAITDALDDIETADESVTVTTELPETAPLVTNAEALTTVLRSPLENAIRYADSEVSVAVDAESDGYTVEIHDDGPGIPAGELSALRTDREPQLQHGRGLGLWQLKWGVAELGGEFSITTDGGTTVRMQLPDLDQT